MGYEPRLVLVPEFVVLSPRAYELALEIDIGPAQLSHRPDPMSRFVCQDECEAKRRVNPNAQLEQFRRGLEVELEHGARDEETNVTHDDLGLTRKIAGAHLKEFPDCYTRLDQLEVEAAAYWTSRR